MAFSGGGRVWTHMLVPLWLLDRLHVTEKELRRDLVKSWWPRKQIECDGGVQTLC